MSSRLHGSLDEVSSGIENLLSFVDKCGIFSLSYNPLNELIWAHYGGSHQGFCVGYDLEKLVSFEPTQFNRIDVVYDNCEPSIQINDLFLQPSLNNILQKILGTKSSPWHYEEEVRVVTTPSGLHEHDFRAVKEIYFGLRCPLDTRIAIMETLAGRCVKYKQVTSPTHSYLLAAEDVPDAFLSSPPYKSHIAPIEEHAIDTTNLAPEFARHADYLRMAAEIVRRDPYCPLVETVGFSMDRSTPQNPVIFALYQRIPGKWVRTYLTPKEIDEQFKSLYNKSFNK